MDPNRLPPGQQLAAPGKWPVVGEREAAPVTGDWELRVAGLVASPGCWSLAELQQMPQASRSIDVHCVTRWSILGAPFTGIPLSELLRMARPLPAARFVSFVSHSPRAHSTSLSLDDARQLDVLIALEFDGRPITPEHGGPVRAVTPGRYFYKSVKWLTGVELLPDDRLGFWEATSGYHNRADPWSEERFVAGGISKQEAAQIFARRDLAGREYVSLDGSDRDLVGLQARGAILRNADFRRSRLAGACFDNANLSNARFLAADLRNASLQNADLEGTNFCGCDLRGADLRGASLFGALFVDPDAGDAPAAPPPAAILDATTLIDAAALDALTPTQAAFVADRLAHAPQQTGE